MEDDTSSANYDPSSGYLTIILTKQTKGQNFEDLDLLSKLLAPRLSHQHPVIEVIGEQGKESTAVSPEVEALASKVEALSIEREREEILRAAENDWQVEQGVSDVPLCTSVQKHYGFLDLHSGYFTNVTHTENEVNELGSHAEVCLPSDRRRLRLEHEDKKFDEEYYMADYVDEENIQHLLEWNHPHNIAKEVEYTEEEKLTMLKLPRREYLATPLQVHNLYLTLLTLLFSYAYDSRTTQHDPTPESAWTIASLTPAFSALDPPSLSTTGSDGNLLDFTPDELRDALLSSYRRSLAFPLYRSFALAEACRRDVAHFLEKGKRTVIRCFLEIKNILDHHEVYYVYSKIWVDDYCEWIQVHAREEVFARLGKQLKGLEVDKDLLGWGLLGLEGATEEVGEREPDSDDPDSEDDEPAPL